MKPGGSWGRSGMRLRSVFETATAVLIALVAAFEAAIEAQRSLPETELMMPIAGWMRIVPLALLLLVGFLWFCQLFIRRRMIEILTPLEHEIVPHLREVRGSIWPPTEPLQIFVLVGREWQPQHL